MSWKDPKVLGTIAAQVIGLAALLGYVSGDEARQLVESATAVIGAGTVAAVQGATLVGLLVAIWRRKRQPVPPAPPVPEPAQKPSPPAVGGHPLFHD